jgi:O-methyltransferase
MRKEIRNIFLKGILKIVPDSDRLRALVNRPKLETWHRSHSEKYPVYENRNQMYDYINNDIIGNRRIQYLEFGVYKGASINYFSSINSDPASVFVGFDTFEGIPEDWVDNSRTVKSKTFSTNGELPQTSDKRVLFIKGLFQETLPEFIKKYQPSGQLVVHNDSDLYSANLYVLTAANNILVPGSIIIFDEFYSVMHEFRALEDFCSSYMRSYEVIAAVNKHEKIAIRML